MWAEGSGMWATLANWGNILGVLHVVDQARCSGASALVLSGSAATEEERVCRPRRLAGRPNDKQWQTADTFLREPRPSCQWGRVTHPWPTDSWLLMLWYHTRSWLIIGIDIEYQSSISWKKKRISDYIELSSITSIISNINVHSTPVLLPYLNR